MTGRGGGQEQSDSGLEAAIDTAVAEGRREIDRLEGQVSTLLDRFEQASMRLRRWDSSPTSSAAALITMADDVVKDVGLHFERQRSILETFNIVFFGRTGAGKSTILSAFGELDGERVSPGESDWTTAVEPIPWRGCLLYDTPGIGGYGRTQKRESLEETARAAVEKADVVLLCFDSASQQASEFAKVAAWVRGYGKPAIALLNVRNPLWRHPARVPSQRTRRSLSDAVRQHRQNIESELAKIGLGDSPIVAVQSRRGLMARASTPYLGPDQVNFESSRIEYGVQYLLEWSNYQSLEALISAMVLTGGADLRLTALRDGVRSTLNQWESALQELEKQALEDAATVERTVQNALDVLGYPAADEYRTRYLWDGRVTGDLLTVNERARRDPYTSPVTGRLERHTRSLLQAHLAKVRATSLRTAENLILDAFAAGKEVSGTDFRHGVFDNDKVDRVAGLVWERAGEFLEREMEIAISEGVTDISFFQQKRVDIAGRAGWKMRYAANTAKTGGLAAGGVAAALGVALATQFWNPAGWVAGVTLAGLGVASGLMKWVGGGAARKAERKRVAARSQAIGGARRSINDYYDDLEERLCQEVVTAAWEHSAAAARKLLWESTTMRLTLDEVRQLAESIGHNAREIAEPPAACVVMQRAQQLVLDGRPSSTPQTPDEVWLGEDWILTDSGVAEVRDRPASDALQAREHADSDRLAGALRDMWRDNEHKSPWTWLESLEKEAARDPDIARIRDECGLILADGRPKVTLIGDFSSGKSSLVKRLLVEAGKPVPPDLGVRADPTTDSSHIYQFDRLTLMDTPGFQSGRERHDTIALESAVDASVVVFLFHVNLVLGDTTLLESVVLGDSSIPAKGSRTLFLINRCDELGVDPVEAPDEFLIRRSRKEAELRMALESKGIHVSPDRIHTVSGDPYGLVGDSHDVTRNDYSENNRVWDGIRPLLSALDGSADLMSTHGASRSAVDLAIARLLTLDRSLEQEAEAVENSITNRQAVLRTLNNAEKDAELLHQALAQEASIIIRDNANSVLADALGAGPDEMHAMAERLSAWWQDEPLVAELERYLTRASKRIDRWYQSFSSNLGRDLLRVVMNGTLPEFQRAFETDSLTGRGWGKSKVVAGASGQAAKLADAVGTRDAVYAIGKAVGHKFKPWGAVKGGVRVAKVGAVLAIVAVAFDAGSWISDIKSEGKREQARQDAVDYVRETIPQAVRQVTNGRDGQNGPLPYLDGMRRELTELGDGLSREQQISEDRLKEIRAQRATIENLLSPTRHETGAGNQGDHNDR